LLVGVQSAIDAKSVPQSPASPPGRGAVCVGGLTS